MDLARPLWPFLKKVKALLPLGFLSLLDPVAQRMLVVGIITIAGLIVVLSFVVVFIVLFSQKLDDRLIRLITAISSPNGSKDGRQTAIANRLIRLFTAVSSLWKM